MMDGRPGRGRLRVYAGMCEGAGTTRRMLDEARRLQAVGRDVVVGVAGPWTDPGLEAVADGLERVPPVSVAYRGVSIEALDLDACVARRPEVVLVDELWREAPPGMRPATRWAAVEALRAVGIDVIATLDLGHLASLADAVQTITGVTVRERLPDAVFDDADEVEFVDASPATIRARITDGRVVAPERIGPLLDRVYTTANLAALRDLALRAMARRAEREIRTGDGPPSREPAGAVAVLVDGGPGGREALRSAAALSAGLRLRLVAVAPSATPGRGGRVGDASAAADDLELARDLGADVVALPAADAVEALALAARGARAGHLVVPMRPSSLGDRLRGRSLAQRLAAEEPEFELHLVPVRDGSA